MINPEGETQIIIKYGITYRIDERSDEHRKRFGCDLKLVGIIDVDHLTYKQSRDVETYWYSQPLHNLIIHDIVQCNPLKFKSLVSRIKELRIVQNHDNDHRERIESNPILNPLMLIMSDFVSQLIIHSPIVNMYVF